MEPRVHSVPVPGGRRISVRCWPGEGEPLVLLHGLLDSSEGWARLAARLPRPCMAVDLPGFGASTMPWRARLDAYAEDVAATLARLDVETCTVVGHSLGGGVAAELVERTDRVSSLVLLAPVGFGRIRLAERITMPGVLDLATLALPLALINPLTVTAAYAAFVGHGRLPERELLERLRHRAARAPLGVRAATLAIAHAGRADDGLRHRRLAFGGPVAALWGTHDALVPQAHADGVRAALPQARIEVWDGMGHHPQRERPRQLAHFLAQHLAGAGADAYARPLAA